MFQRIKSVHNNNGCLYFGSLRYKDHRETLSTFHHHSQHNCENNNTTSQSSSKSLPCLMPRHLPSNDIEAHRSFRPDWKQYTRFSDGSMSSTDKSTPDSNSLVNVWSTDDGSNSSNNNNNNSYDDITTEQQHLCPNFTCMDYPLFGEINDNEQRHPLPVSSTLSTFAWSIYVVLHDSDDEVSTLTSTKFRLVRNSEPSSGMYLYGMEIIHAIDSIYDRDHAATFSIIFSSMNSSTNHNNEIYVANDVYDIRAKLYRTMVPSEITFVPRPQKHHHFNNNDNEMIPVTTIGRTPVAVEARVANRANIFRSASTYVDQQHEINSRSSDSFMVRIPMIESTMEFDDDDDFLDDMVGGNDLDESSSDNVELLWENTMIHDVVSSLIAIGIHDTSIATSLWTTLSSSSSDSSSNDNNRDNGSEMEMMEV